jgi:hypothetical protein
MDNTKNDAEKVGTCPKCGGSGEMTCPICNGSGTNNYGKTCTHCKGLGTVQCSRCYGNGCC